MAWAGGDKGTAELQIKGFCAMCQQGLCHTAVLTDTSQCAGDFLWGALVNEGVTLMEERGKKIWDWFWLGVFCWGFPSFCISLPCIYFRGAEFG